MRNAVAVVASLAVLAGLAGCGSDLPAKAGDFLLVRPPGSYLSPPDDAKRLTIEKALAYGPHVGLAAEWIFTADEVDAEDGRRLNLSGGMRAADGHEFLFVRMADDTRYVNGRWGRPGDPPAKAAAQVTVGDRVQELEAVPEPGSLLIVSVPERTPARLTVTDEGRPISIDLRSGQPKGGIGDVPRQSADAGYEGSGRIATPAGGRSLDIDISITEATLEPYLPGLGWAKTGRAWLRLSLDQVSSDAVIQSSADEPAVGFFIDPAVTFELIARGVKLRPKAGLAFNTMRPAARYLAVMDAPASFRSGELRIAPDGPLFMYRGGSTLSQYTNLSRVPDCGPTLRAVCLDWQRRPEPKVVKLALR